MGAPRASRWVLLAGLLVVAVSVVLMVRPDDPGGGASATPLARLGRTDDAPRELPAVVGPDGGAAAQPIDADAAGESAAAAARGATSLLVRVTWSDGLPAADIGLRILSWAGPEPRRYVRLARTNAQGEWFAPSIAPGQTTAYADRGAAQSKLLAPGEAGEIDVLIPAGVRVRGLVVNDAKEPVAEADVFLLTGGDSIPLHPAARSDAAGRFDLRDVQPGVMLQARSRLQTASRRIQVGGEVGGDVEVSLVLGIPACSVSGTVTSAKGRPVADALVRVGPGSWPAVFVLSDAEGRFLAEGVRTGWVPIAAIAPGFSPAEHHVQLGIGETADVQLELGPSTHVSGCVRDAEGRPVPTVQISIGELGDMLASEATSGADGRYAMVDVAPGVRRVTALHPAAGRSSVRLELDAGERATWDPVLGAGSRIAGTVLDASGAPAADLRLEARPIDEDTPGQSQTTTDAAGVFELQDVPPGPQRLMARGGLLGGLELEIASPVEPGTRDLVVRLPQHFLEPSRISGRLVDPRGAPVAGEFHVTNVATGAEWKARADASTGRFEAGPVPLGHYEPYVEPDDRPVRDFPAITVPPASTVDIGDLVLPAGGRIVAYITAPEAITGSPLLGTYVYCRATDGNASESLELADGAWRSPPVPPGTYELVIHTRDYAAPHREVRVEEGLDTDVHVNLLPGVHQELRFFATPPAGASGIAFDVVVRTPAGEVAWAIRNETLPMLDKPVEDEDTPLLGFSALLLPGTYLVDVTLGERSMTAMACTTDAATPWKFDLR